MDRCTATAKDVSERLLERTGTALMTGNFEKFADCFLLPQEMETFDGRRKVQTRDDLLEVFRGVTTHLRRKNVTEFVRHCIEARFRDDDTIVTTHMSRLLSGHTLAQTPYPVMCVLRRVDGEWKVSDGMYAVEDEPYLSKALSG